MFTLSKMRKMGLSSLRAQKIGLQRENKCLRPDLRAYNRSKSIENKYITFKSLKTESKILKNH